MLRRKKGPPRAGGPKKRDHKEVERGSLPDRITVSSELESNLSHRIGGLRAIKRGALTGTKDHNDVWHVDGAELARVFPVNTQLAPQDTHPDALAAHKLALAEERITELKERLEEMRQERDRARASEDAWKTQCEAITRQLALPAPNNAQSAQQPAPPAPEPSRFRRAWRWMRATG
jgi:hypothetical protein